MGKAKLIRRTRMFCCICDKEHDVAEMEREETITYKGVKVTYPEIFYFCEDSADKDPCEFWNGWMLGRNRDKIKEIYNNMKKNDN